MARFVGEFCRYISLLQSFHPHLPMQNEKTQTKQMRRPPYLAMHEVTHLSLDYFNSTFFMFFFFEGWLAV